MAAALCQGAALHFLGRGKGVKDLDIHLFYIQHPKRQQLSRRVYSLEYDFPTFGRRRVDFIRTVIPEWVVSGTGKNAIKMLQALLHEEPTANSHHLAQKAVIGLLPRSIFGAVVWPVR